MSSVEGIQLLAHRPSSQRQAYRCFLLSSVTCLSKGGNGATSAPIKRDAAPLGRKTPLLPSIPSFQIHTHNLGLFSSYPHAVPAPTVLMFIHQPLPGQTQRLVKTKSDLFFNDARPSTPRLRKPSLVASWQTCVKKMLATTFTGGKPELCGDGGGGRMGVWGGGRRRPQRL